MTIRHDPSSTSIVTTCTRCSGFWFAFSFDREEARKSAERHELEVHGIEPRAASAARRQAEYRARLAGRS
jgi:hypothetical protein